MSDASARKDTPAQAEFRAYCRDWLAANKPGEPPVRLPQTPLEIMTTEQLDYLQAWQKAAYDAGLVGCDYPEAVGGGGRKDCQRVANEEMLAARTPFFPNVIGLGMAAPTVFYHAQEAVKAELLPRLFSGEDIWCQGFSEPGAGSDLASVQTFAEKRGDRWVINGHKVWTSLAHFAEWMIILLRTDKSHKYDGLSYFVVPIRAALGNGVTVRPLIKITGETGFNEVIFDNLEVDDRYRLDELGKGWQVAMTTLLHERGAGELQTPRSGGMKNRSSHNITTSAVIELARQTRRGAGAAADDPLLRDKLMRQLIREEGLKQNQRRSRVQALLDHPMRLPLQNKLLASEIAQSIASLAVEVEGMASSLYMGDSNAPAGGQWPLSYMNSYGMTIAAGTSEVQRNILGERVLGLPKSK
ncbi:MAG: acyl-CoA dehydrogenase [Haliea sp.]|uniref:acyl-CoA dehydrogenase family protein n=1 Tax=Haliea sp. TaxID=1932666 RepID=UPI000C639A8D|nr:acyl-CoA dehydrogenase family protein [Haliea sp.]MBM68412.1 acyl-CoA dehydrogenase [Haliea sp.]|tara:strand:- start:26444 stop:27682 length:1239 start_codon:yes stop_codon:yes gene_type:complete